MNKKIKSGRQSMKNKDKNSGERKAAFDGIRTLTAKRVFLKRLFAVFFRISTIEEYAELMCSGLIPLGLVLFIVFLLRDRITLTMILSISGIFIVGLGVTICWIKEKITEINVVYEEWKKRKYKVAFLKMTYKVSFFSEDRCYMYLTDGKSEEHKCRCSFSNYLKFRKGDTVCVLYNDIIDYPIMIFREEEWNYDEEMQRMIDRAKKEYSKEIAADRKKVSGSDKDFYCGDTLLA